MSLCILTYRWLPRLVAFVALGDDFNKKMLRSEPPEASDVSVYTLINRMFSAVWFCLWFPVTRALIGGGG